jgi:hypothetical protein
VSSPAAAEIWTVPETVEPAVGSVTETVGEVVSQAVVTTSSGARGDLFPAASNASTPMGVEEPHGRPLTDQVVPAVVPSDVAPR